MIALAEWIVSFVIVCLVLYFTVGYLFFKLILPLFMLATDVISATFKKSFTFEQRLNQIVFLAVIIGLGCLFYVRVQRDIKQWFYNGPAPYTKTRGW